MREKAIHRKQGEEEEIYLKRDVCTSERDLQKVLFESARDLTKRGGRHLKRDLNT